MPCVRADVKELTSSLQQKQDEAAAAAADVVSWKEKEEAWTKEQLRAGQRVAQVGGKKIQRGEERRRGW